MDPNLNGKWGYRSFHADPIVVKDGKVDGNPDLARPLGTPWRNGC